VSVALALETANIHERLAVESRKAVDSVRSEIQEEADHSVKSIVATQINPEFVIIDKRLHETDLFNLASAGYGPGFDEVTALANDANESEPQRTAAASLLSTVKQRIEASSPLTGGCAQQISPTLSKIRDELQSDSADERLTALNCASDYFNSHHGQRNTQDFGPFMEALYGVMQNDV
jgi:hypothetical protein